MLGIHGLVKITEVEPIQKKSDHFWILPMKIVARHKKKEGDSYKDIYTYYRAKMLFNRQDEVDAWVQQMTVGRVVDIRWAELQGNDAHGGGWVEVVLKPNIRHVIPKYKETLDV